MRHPSGERVPGQPRLLPRWTRPTIGVAVLALLAWWLGIDPFLDPLRRINAGTLLAATLIAVPTTVCCAWRWQLVSRALGSELSLRPAIASYYRSQFLNTVLPGGVLGDIQRAARRGRETGALGHAARVVVWERSAGQVVQVALTILVLLAMPSPVRSSVPGAALAAMTFAVAVVLLLRALPDRSSSPAAAVVGALTADLRAGLLSSRAWPGVVVASTVVVAGHAATFMIAAQAAGTGASVRELLPLTLLVLLVTTLPMSVAGWGPREAGATGVFAMAGLGAAQGLSTAVMYGALVIVATSPGAVLILMSSARPRTREATGVAVPGCSGRG